MKAALDFTHERNADLMRAFRRHLNDVSRIYMEDIFYLVSESPASRFWVSEERAAIVISAMIAGRKLPKMRPNKKEMFEEIFRRYNIAKQLNPDKSLSCLVAEIVHQPAPKFYLTPRTAGELLRKIKNGFYR